MELLDIHGNIRSNFFLGGEGKLIPGNAVVGLIVLNHRRYLCQLRSNKSGIFYPDHWGLFGGAVDYGENPEAGLKRELYEELALEVDKVQYFTEFTFDFSFCGLGHVWRRYYLIPINYTRLNLLQLSEGQEFRVFTANELLSQSRVVPYDAFAVWMHATWPE